MEDFTKKPEIMLVSYDEVIRNPYPFILNQMRTTYRKYYEDFLYFDIIDNLDESNLLRLCIQRTEKNVLRMMNKKDFDVDKTLKDIHVKFKDMYLQSPLLAVGSSISFLLSQRFIDTIYIHTTEYDERVHLDIQMTYKDMTKVKYITGPMSEVIQQLEGVTSYIFNDIMDVASLLATDKCAYTNVMVANYGYNYTLNEEDQLILRLELKEMSEEKIFKFATFMPINLTEKHFSLLNQFETQE